MNQWRVVVVELEWGLYHMGSDAISKVRTKLKWRTPVASQNLGFL